VKAHSEQHRVERLLDELSQGPATRLLNNDGSPGGTHGSGSRIASGLLYRRVFGGGDRQFGLQGTFFILIVNPP
jgi:hypothetical protein